MNRSILTDTSRSFIENGKLHFSWHLLPNVRNVHGLHNWLNIVDPFFVSHT